MRRSISRSMQFRRILLIAAASSMLGLGSTARAHFLWLTAEREGDKLVILAFLSEPPVPDLPAFMRTIERAVYSADGRQLEAERGEETFVLRLPEETPRIVDGNCDLGVMTKNGSTFRLLYTARVQLVAVSTDEPETGDGLRIRMVGAPGENSEVLITFDGRPAAGAEVKAYMEDGDDQTLIADDSGRVDCTGLADRPIGLLAKWPDGTPGVANGTPFDETRHYATLTVAQPDFASVADELGAFAVPRDERPIAHLPEPVNSFGGAVLGDWLYVYSGHIGTTHRYHTGTTTPHFYRLDLKDRQTWEELPCGPALQGVALVAHGGGLYRVGGMAARNALGEEHDLVSVADVSRFDPFSKEWTDLPPLPEPRSTHDAAVLGDHLYVVGGWSMTGGDSADAFFLDDALRLDLTDPGSEWERLPAPPNSRRALAVAAFDGRIFVLGGLTEQGGTVRDVDIFDPTTGTWSSGPELPGKAIQGFAPSAFEVEDRLIASGGNGTVYRLSERGDSWEPIADLAVPRITHRLLPGIEADVLIVGGNFAGVPVRFIESLPIAGVQGESNSVIWSAPFPGEVLRSRAVGVIGNQLLVAGGNRSRDPHAFEADNLSVEAYRFLPDGAAGRAVAPLPEPRQSGVLVEVAEGRRSTTYHLGGIGEDDGVVRTLGDVYRLDEPADQWTKLPARLPDDRGMFGTAVVDGSLWVFGGSVMDPSPRGQGGMMPTEILRWQPARDGATFETTGHHLPRPRRSFAGAMLDGTYYMVGGLGEDQELVEVSDCFDVSSGEWGVIPSPDRPRVFADLVQLGGTLYLGGGYSRGATGHFEPARSIEAYDPDAQAWRTVLEDAPIQGDGLRMMSLGGRLVLISTDIEEAGQAQLAIVAPGMDGSE